MPFALRVKTVVSYNIPLDLNKFFAILFYKGYFKDFLMAKAPSLNALIYLILDPPESAMEQEKYERRRKYFLIDDRN
jgi:hypothetical protein